MMQQRIAIIGSSSSSMPSPAASAPLRQRVAVRRRVSVAPAAAALFCSSGGAAPSPAQQWRPLPASCCRCRSCGSGVAAPTPVRSRSATTVTTAAARSNAGRRAGRLRMAIAAQAAAAAASPEGASQQPQQQQQPSQQQQRAQPMTVAITGATGLIGSRLTAKLASQGHTVRVLTRDVAAARARLPYPRLTFHGNAPGAWEAAITGADAVVNLAGTPIGSRWTPEIKAQIRASRLAATARVAAAISAAPEGARPRVFVSSSAIGFYGASQTASFTEDSPPGADYLAGVCTEWEAAARRVPAGVRVVVVRTGIVLARDGGALAKLLPSFEIFAGGPLGSGRQWLSWIHRDDLVALMAEALVNDAYRGTYNGVAPRPVTMAQLCSAVGGVLGKPSWLPVPDFAVSGLLGEGARVVLEGQRVLPSRAQEAGFKFRYGEIDGALRQLLR